MNDAKVMQLFQALISLPDAEPWRDLAEAEMNAVRAELRAGADPDDPRLDFYAAARAFLQYRRLMTQSVPTYAGTVAGGGQGAFHLVEQFVNTYRAACAPLLRDDTFFFAAAQSGKGGCT